MLTDAVLRWRELATVVGGRHRLAPELVLAVTQQESAGDPCAWRYEPAFLTTYAAGIARVVRETGSLRDDHWLKRDSHVLATSYGLMQCLTVVAIERGMLELLRYPTSLCDPELGLEAGCRHLRWCLDRRGGDLAAGLARYNGGGKPEYAPSVLRMYAAAGGARVV